MDTETDSENAESKTLVEKKFHVIGVGASAGGVAALQDFFGYIGNDLDACFIVVQHLSPDFKSMMDELLRKSTTIPVQIAADGQELKPGNIYLNPPRKNLTVRNGLIHLVDYEFENGLNLPIDSFFASLAATSRHRAVAVILSGSGSDGSNGIRAVKEAGGVVFVQDPEEASFDGMPRMAIASGMTDRVLQLERLAHELCQYINNPVVREDKGAIKVALQGSDDLISEIVKVLHAQSGVDFALYKSSTVARRIQRRIGINQQTSLQEFISYLQNHPEEIEILAKELLIGVTRFFRDENAFAELKKSVIPDLVANSSSESIRVWVPACSTGEEAYSLAILIHDEMNRTGKWKDIKIFATDIDDEAIQKASAGRYSADIVNDVKPTLLKYYFVQDGDTYIVSGGIRKSIIFAKHNILTDPPFSNMDLVSCRNFLIYLQNIAQRKVLGLLRFSLKQHGYLFLGSSESLSEQKSQFFALSEKHRIFKRMDDSRIIAPSKPLLASRSSKTVDVIPSVKTILRNARSSEPSTPITVVKDRLVDVFFPPTIILNQDEQAIHIFGDVSFFVKRPQQGELTHKIGSVLEEPLPMVVASAIHKLGSSGEEIIVRDVLVEGELGDHKVDIEIRRLKNDKTDRVYFSVSFVNRTVSAKKKSMDEEYYDDLVQSRQRIDELEADLCDTREHLQLTIEELETTNEELQSANEELMSANEELQSTNEELQSVNEELYTVNSEYQNKISELTEVNSDLDSLIESAEFGILFLDKELTIRKYTERAQRYFNLIESDIGRPFDHIRNKLDYESLLDDVIVAVSSQKQTIKSVVNSKDETILIKINPLTMGVGDGGCVITTTDVSQATDQLRQLNQSQDILELALRAGDIGVWSWCPDEDTVEIDKRVANFIGLVGDQSALNLNQFLKYFKQVDDQLELENIIREASSKERSFDIDVAISNDQNRENFAFSLRGGSPKNQEPYGKNVMVTGVLLRKSPGVRSVERDEVVKEDCH